MTVKKSTFSNRFMEREWWCGTCSNDSLFVTAKVVGSSVFEFSLQPSIELVEEHRPPIFCTQDEFISDISASNNFLAIAVVNDKDDVRFDLYAIGTRQQAWSLQLDRIPSTCRIRCCTLNNDQWIMIDRNKRELYHISQNGKLINKEKYREVPWNAVQFNINCIAILTKQNINLHQLF
ncbi:hypothetical protein I4U23_012254 [Adineta vaga]|nr:hypothetical protein I4U23_012254 [Adineta vaga]